MTRRSSPVARNPRSHRRTGPPTPISLRETCNGLSCCVGKMAHLGIPGRPINPRCPMPTSTGSRSYTRICSTPPSRGSATKKDWGLARRSSVSGTSCHRSTRPPFRCAWSCFHGPGFAGKRRRQGSRAAGPRRLPAELRADHRSQTQLCQDGRGLHSQPRLHRGDGSRV